MKLFKTKEARNAFYIGGMCTIAYLITYLGRNILSAISPQIIEEGVFGTEFIGTLSSLFFICYAFGQLLNGIIGDKIRANYMISLGLILSGAGGICFSFLTGYPKSISVIYGMMGFFLSMIFAPMVKITAENTTTAHAVYCGVGYEMGALLGAPIAGILSLFLNWKNVLRSGSFALILMGILCLIGFSVMRHKRIIKYNRYREVMDKEDRQKGGIRALIEHDIIRFTPIAMLTGIVRTTVVFWIPTYLTQHLEFTTETASGIYTVVTLLISSSVFLSVFLYIKLDNNMYLTILLGFAVSTAAFVGAYFIGQKWINISLLVLAIIFEQVASSMLWTRYCPSLRDTGMTSSATGFLDFASYMAAAIASSLFANSVESIGWGNLILIWAGLMLVGVLIVIPHRNPK
ncbi:MAG: MFS transporter [Lachnospiraceae bacterium]|nr:MFS transporter [Lachnospiraceae bacterium]